MNFLRKYFPVVLVLFLTFISYSNILDNQFISDDKSFIIEWSQPKNLKENFSSLIQGDLPQGQEGVYRPIRSIIYAFSYELWSVNLRGFHILSIITHLTITFLIYLISQKIFKNNFSAFIAALFFGIHPIHTEAVTWVTASMDTISFIFFFGSFYLYLLWEEKKKIIYKSLSVVLFLLSVFHYELAVTLPLMILSYEYFINKKTIKQSFISSLEYFISLGIYLFIRLVLVDVPGRARYMLNSPFQTWIVMIIAMVKYLWLLIYPINLQYNHEILDGITGLFHFEYHSQKIIQFPTLTSSPFLISSIIILAIFIAIYKLRKKVPIISFSLSIIFISLIPALQLIPTSTIFAERYTYPGSLGIVLIFSWVISYLSHNNKLWMKNFAIIITAIISIFFIKTTYQRNTEWHNPIRFWSSELKNNKNSSYVNGELATAYSQNGDLKKAKKYLEISIKNNPTFPTTISNLAYIYLKEEDYYQAITLYKKSVELKPNLLHAYIGMAEAFTKIDEPEIAAQIYQELIDKNPYYFEPYINLSSLLLESDPQRSLELVLKAQKISPHRIETYKALGYIYLENDQLKKARENFIIYTQKNPDDLHVINQLKQLQ